ncbi:hypothetical protein [Actinoplanes sp. NPDC051851]|uniref:hypothetical protein n=1 Tax=Actinoplanes sp. NPDC051851 TaxID=3154753 RepID=UPI0034369CF9
MRLYLAEGVAETVVGRRPPSAPFACDHLVLGSLVLVRPRETLLGQQRITYAVPRTAGWRLLGRTPGDYRVLTHRDDRADLRRAADAAVMILDRWPLLRDYLPMDEPSATLAAALWSLTGVLTDRHEVRLSHARLTDIDPAVPRGSRIHAELTDRADQARLHLRRLDTSVAHRIRHLTRMADETEAFVRQEQAISGARALLRDTTHLLDDPAALSPALPPPPTDDAADLADHTSAVMSAYRDLSGTAT